MDFLVRTYFFDYLPFKLSENSEKLILNGAMHVLNWANWFCGAQDVRVMLQQHPSVLFTEIVYGFLSLLVLIHALRHGQRTYYLYVCSVVCSLCMSMVHTSATELSYDAQSVLTFVGRRAAMFVVVGVQPAALYAAAVVVKNFVREHLVAVAVGAFCGIFIPLLSMEIIVAARHFHVPCSSMTLSYLILFATLYLFSEQMPFRTPARSRLDEVTIFILLHLTWLFTSVALVDTAPEGNASVGMHQPIGACTGRMTAARTPILRMQYEYVPVLCATQLKMTSPFDFHCLPDKLPPRPRPNELLEWYTICGRRQTDTFEFIVSIAASCSFVLLLCMVLLLKGQDLGVPSSRASAGKKTKKYE